MEIRFYDSALNFKGIMENQTSLLWTRKYYEPGTFELYTPITADNMKLVKRGYLIWVKGNVEAGVIEDVKLEESKSKNEITVKGRFLESYMDRRLIMPAYTFSGLTEVAMRTILTNATAIPLVQLGTLKGFTETVAFQATYKGLLDYEKKLAKSAGFGFRFYPDFDNKTITFQVYKGTDRTSSQGVNNRVIFSEEYENLNNVVYRENDQLYKTMAYVGGETVDNVRKYVSTGSGTGLNLREVFVDASDCKSTNLTTAEYENQLKQRGTDALNDDVISQSFESETNPNVNFVYKTNYDLGDIVTIKKKAWGITQDLRITELQEVYEYGSMTVVPTFGTALPETIDWSE